MTFHMNAVKKRLRDRHSKGKGKGKRKPVGERGRRARKKGRRRL